MAESGLKTFLQALALGALSGMRSMSSPAFLSDQLANHQPNRLEGKSLAPLARRPTSKLLKVLAAGEMIADKLPMAPNRTALPLLAGRAGSGALVGAAVFSSQGRPSKAGALIGAIGAVAAAYGALHLRRRLGRRTRIPDPVIGLMEDAVVAMAASRLRRLPEHQHH